MPEIKFQHVVSCSSEDETHKADNLLKPETYRKWKCATAGEKQATVILQFEKSSTIHSIDIGNEGSAFIEVLVGKSSSEKADDYQVILVTSSFMSPADSKNGTNTNRVRFFGQNQLTKTVLDKSWDRVKVVCTQPFNKTNAYGLSFIKMHSTPAPGEQSSDKAKEVTSQNINKLGHFKLKETTQSSVAVGSYFKNRDKPEPSPLKGAAAVRAASSVAEQALQATSLKHKRPAEVQKVATPSPKQQTPVKRKSIDKERVADKHTPRQLASGNDQAKRKTESPQQVPPMKKRKSDVTKPSTKNKPFGQLMEGVVFVISGFQNPHRSDIRDKALEMGAKYKGDWGKGCTHLICAFANTPKYQAVKGRGKIVKKGWILDSYKQQTLLPWKRYKLSSPNDSSSDETEEEEESPAKKTPVKANPSQAMSEDEESDDDMDTETAAGTSVKGKTNKVDSSSESNTEDEIRRVQHGDTKEDSYGSSTDVDSENETASSKAKTNVDEGGDIPELPSFFTDKHFLLYGKFDDLERRNLVRYITAFNGELEDYMSEVVSYIITKSQWDDSFDQALEENAQLTFVRPKWVFACGEKGKMMPYQPYVIVPVN
ncbi:DNA repair protein XRCC1-like isoform X2 [Antedon mediterranea]|uniref:DNA repair protein XRCC1-like isoform X2 n=1 Tax=Antedon mediterranea TaxID=105859 RepID=UPI003AF5B3BA